MDSPRTRKHGGSGLGLAILNQTVALMGGKVELESRPEEGSVFTVHLPLALARPPSDAVGNPANEAVEEVAELRASEEAISSQRVDRPFVSGGRVLVVDDEQQSRLYTQFMLRNLNADVTTAASGFEALALCEQQRFDLILMDVRMPDLDGLDTARHIRQQRHNARTPIIGLTADASNVDQLDWEVAGMNGCYYKPLKPPALTEIFSQWGLDKPAKKASLAGLLRKYYER